MRHLEKFKIFEQKIELSEEELNNIDKLLKDKFIEENIEPTPHALFSELDLIKKDANNSFLFYIIKHLLNIDSRQRIIQTAIKFFEARYGEIIKKYKEDRRKEFDIRNQKSGPDFLLPYNDEIVRVPFRIGHGYIPVKILPLEELKTKYSRHKRLKVFGEKGLQCVSCPKEGYYLIAAKDRAGGIHVDVYTKDFELMTVDHIKPRSIGGTYDIENLDPMCQTCNSKKADKYEDLEG